MKPQQMCDEFSVLMEKYLDARKYKFIAFNCRSGRKSCMGIPVEITKKKDIYVFTVYSVAMKHMIYHNNTGRHKAFFFYADGIKESRVSTCIPKSPIDAIRLRLDDAARTLSVLIGYCKKD